MQKGAAYWMDLKYFNDEDPIFLAQVQKGITNFVKILTGKDIPVQYATSGDSMTDGETVYIASNLKEDTIDYTVGLALHEASHVLLTDFDYINQTKGNALKRVYKLSDKDLDNVFLIINYIEDRRIDNYVYTNAPGYQYYYEELYRKSFYNKIVDNNLQSEEFRIPTWDAYFFRLINILNRNSDLNALPGLQEIYDLIDIKNINRLQSTQDSVEVAVEIFNVISKYVIEENNQDKTPKEFQIKEYVEKQKNFINSKYRKRRVHKKIKEKINKLAANKTTLQTVTYKETNYPTIVSEDWEEFFKVGSQFNSNVDYVNKGFILGKRLLKLLKDRDTTKQEIFENLKKGKLNSKKLFQAPFYKDIFYRIEKENYKNIFLHISLDLSSSMSGEKFIQTIQTTSAIAYAACHLNNFDVEISLRGTAHSTDYKNERPVLVYLFNSKKDSLTQLKSKLNQIEPRGATPEGICLEIVGKNLPSSNYYTDVYLLNISDGMPTMFGTGYKSEVGIQHTKQVVNKIRKNNIKILSYFIDTPKDHHYVYDNAEKDFTKMYGKDAKFINIDNINSISKTINDLLLSDKIKVS